MSLGDEGASRRTRHTPPRDPALPTPAPRVERRGGGAVRRAGAARHPGPRTARDGRPRPRRRGLGRRARPAHRRPPLGRAAVRHHRHDDPGDRGRPAPARAAPASRGPVRGRRGGRDLAGDHRAEGAPGPRPAGVAGQRRPADDQVVPVGPRVVHHRLHRRAGGAHVRLRTTQLDAPTAPHPARGPVGAGLPRPGAARAALPHRRRRGHAARPCRAVARAGVPAPRAGQPRREGRPPAGGLLDRPATRGHRQPDQGRGRRGVPLAGVVDGPGLGLVAADVALHDRRGPRHRHGRGRVGGRCRPGAGLRRRRHRARGVRRARRHRHPGRHRPGRHRQPARPQPRHPALPALGGRRRAQRPGPRDRPGQGRAATGWPRTATSW